MQWSTRVSGKVVELVQRTDCSVVRLLGSLPRRVRLCVFCNIVCILGPRSNSCTAYWDFYPPLYFSTMPPKLRKLADVRSEEVVGEDTESEVSVSSPVSVASTASGAASMTVPFEYFQKILEANSKILEDNQRSMSAMVAALPTSSVPSVPPPKLSHIDVPKWSDEETPFEYFSKYLKAQKHNGVDRGEWGNMLQVYLSGRAQAAYAQVNEETLGDYDAVKDTMLQSLGDTPEEADRSWWTLRRRNSESIGSFYLRMRSTGSRRFHGLETKEEVIEKVLLSRYLYLLSPECYDSVSAKNPKTGQEASKLVQEYEGRGNFSRRHLSGRSHGSHHYQQNSYSKREQGGSGVGSTHGGSSSTNGSSSSSNGSGGHSSGSSPSPSMNQGTSSSQAGGGKGGRQEKPNQRERKPVTCYGCGEVGHIRPNCPNKVRRVKPEKKEGVVRTVDGFLAGKEVKGLRLDTGADRTLVRQDLIPEDAYTGETVVLDTWRGHQPSRHKVARISIRVGSVEIIGCSSC